MKKPKVVEVFTDNGEHSHWKLVDTSTGITIWEQPEDDSSIIYKGEKEWNESEIDCCKATNEAHNKSIFHLGQCQFCYSDKVK